MPRVETAKPLVLVSACNRMLGAHEFHVAGRKYVDAVRLAGCLPLVLPPLPPPVDAQDIDALLDGVDGVLLTGSKSNIHPRHFGESVLNASLPLDEARDATTFALIRATLERGLPLFGICRGFQEVNVALRGSLHQAVQDVPGLADHRDPDGVPVDVAYGSAHSVAVVPGGLLATLIPEPSFIVNSLHGQGVNRLADGLRAEALAPDGLVEAFSLPTAPGFNLCVQWHPEWQAASNPQSMRMLYGFGAACRRHKESHRAGLS